METNSIDLASLIDTNEEVLWMGTPVVKNAPRGYLYQVAFFSIITVIIFFPHCIESIIWYEMSRETTLFVMLMHTLVLIFVNLGGIILRVKKRTTCYVVTNIRAMIIDTKKISKSKEILFSDVKSVVLRKLSNGIGDIKLLTKMPMYTHYHSYSLMLDVFHDDYDKKLQFLDVEESESVYNTVSFMKPGAYKTSLTVKLL